jgi:site-specific recombinase XerC
MEPVSRTQGIIAEISTENNHLLTWIEAFLLDRKVQNLSPGTIQYYSKKLVLLAAFAEGQGIDQVTQITPTDIRIYLLFLEERGHNPGGIHACFRAVKSFLRWLMAEVEPDGFKNPIDKVKAPKVPQELLDPVSPDVFQALLRLAKRTS